ncbi:hypothetical protein [Gloeothece verrucosa]|nr:hypothetical protein [Gloeothece verrucosa]
MVRHKVQTGEKEKSQSSSPPNSLSSMNARLRGESREATINDRKFKSVLA